MSTLRDVEMVRYALRSDLPGNNPLPNLGSISIDVIRAIGRSTRNGVRILFGALVRVARFVKQKLDEGAEMHNRKVALQDERYMQNWYYLRTIL